jgi:hypothetical protein
MKVRLSTRFLGLGQQVHQVEPLVERLKLPPSQRPELQGYRHSSEFDSIRRSPTLDRASPRRSQAPAHRFGGPKRERRCFAERHPSHNLSPWNRDRANRLPHQALQ